MGNDGEQVQATKPGRGETPYQQWQGEEGVPVYTGSYVDNLHTVEVAPWARVGQKGAIVNLADQEKDDGWVIEIAPGGRSEILHHLFETSVYVVEGRGATTIWQAGSESKQTVEWQSGSLFSPPLNCYYQHFNLEGGRPARLFQATIAPVLINLMRNTEFVFDCPYVFSDRYNGQESYFSDPGRRVDTRHTNTWATNMVPDVRSFMLELSERRVPGGKGMALMMAGNAMAVHMSELPVGTYKRAHRHGPGAELIILSGTGYSLFWFEGEPQRKVDWKEGTLLSPRGDEFHQHFNVGPTPARYLAYTFGDVVVSDKRRMTGQAVSVKLGGWLLPYEDEDPAVYELFEAECRKHGSTVKLPRPVYAQG